MHVRNFMHFEWPKKWYVLHRNSDPWVQNTASVRLYTKDTFNTFGSLRNFIIVQGIKDLIEWLSQNDIPYSPNPIMQSKMVMRETFSKVALLPSHLCYSNWERKIYSGDCFSKHPAMEKGIWGKLANNFLKIIVPLCLSRLDFLKRQVKTLNVFEYLKSSI